MTIEISEAEAQRILNSLGWALSEGDYQDGDGEIIKKLLDAYPTLTDEFSYLR